MQLLRKKVVETERLTSCMERKFAQAGLVGLTECGPPALPGVVRCLCERKLIAAVAKGSQEVRMARRPERTAGGCGSLGLRAKMAC